MLFQTWILVFTICCVYGVPYDSQLVSEVKEIDRRDFCDNCPTIKLPNTKCITEWVPQYSKPNSDGCVCLEKYTCCSNKCKPVDESVCKNGLEFIEIEEDCCGCEAVKCLPCPSPTSESDLNCDKECYHYVKEHSQNNVTKCFESACVPNAPPSYPDVTCNDFCQKKTTELDVCGHGKPKCEFIPENERGECPCPEFPSCDFNEHVQKKTDECGCNHLFCERRHSPVSEVIFSGGSPGASSCYRNDCNAVWKGEAGYVSPAKAFLVQDPQSTSKETSKTFLSNYNQLPVTIWYKFKDGISIIPRRVSFQASNGHYSGISSGFQATKWQFVGTDSATCNKHSYWETVCEDTSGSVSSDKNHIKGCTVDKSITKSFTCLGIRALESQDSYGRVAFRNIRIWGASVEN